MKKVRLPLPHSPFFLNIYTKSYLIITIKTKIKLTLFEIFHIYSPISLCRTQLVRLLKCTLFCIYITYRIVFITIAFFINLIGCPRGLTLNKELKYGRRTIYDAKLPHYIILPRSSISQNPRLGSPTDYR